MTWILLLGTELDTHTHTVWGLLPGYFSKALYSSQKKIGQSRPNLNSMSVWPCTLKNRMGSGFNLVSFCVLALVFDFYLVLFFLRILHLAFFFLLFCIIFEKKKLILVFFGIICIFNLVLFGALFCSVVGMRSCVLPHADFAAHLHSLHVRCRF